MNNHKQTAAKKILRLGIALLSASVFTFAGTEQSSPSPATAAPENKAVVRVNGHDIGEREVATQLEALYPNNTVHGSIKPEKLKELRSKAATELVVEELAFEQAVKEKLLVPMPEVKQEYYRLRTKYGVTRFDTALKASGMTRQEYLQTLQR